MSTHPQVEVRVAEHLYEDAQEAQVRLGSKGVRHATSQGGLEAAAGHDARCRHQVRLVRRDRAPLEQRRRETGERRVLLRCLDLLLRESFRREAAQQVETTRPRTTQMRVEPLRAVRIDRRQAQRERLAQPLGLHAVIDARGLREPRPLVVGDEHVHRLRGEVAFHLSERDRERRKRLPSLLAQPTETIESDVGTGRLGVVAQRVGERAGARTVGLGDRRQGREQRRQDEQQHCVSSSHVGDSTQEPASDAR